MFNLSPGVKPVAGCMVWTCQFVNDANEDDYDDPSEPRVSCDLGSASSVGSRVIRLNGFRRIGLNDWGG